MQNQHTIIRLAAQTTTQCATQGPKSFQVTQPMLKTSKKSYNSTVPSSEISEAITVASQMPSTTLLDSLNTGRNVGPEARRPFFFFSALKH